LNCSSRSIWGMAWPQMLTMLFLCLIGLSDTWAAGRLGREVQAGMGMANQALLFFLVPAIALANSMASAVSQAFGAGRHRWVQRFAGLGLQAEAVMGVVCMGAGILLLDRLTTLMGMNHAVRPVGAYILSIYLYTLPAYCLLIAGNAFFRARRQTAFPLLVMMAVALLNLLGNLTLGLGLWNFPSFGYKGLAWSTFLSVICGAFLVLSLLKRHELLRKTDLLPSRWNSIALPYLVRVAWPSALNQLLWYLAFLVVFATAAALPHGSMQALAGMSAGIRVESMLYLPVFALGLTASVVVGNSVNQLSLQQARNLGYRIMFLGLGIISLPAVLVWFSAGPLAGFMASDPETAREAETFLRFSICAMPFLVVYMILGGAMAGAGATIYQLLVMSGTAWLIRIPLAWYLGHVHLQESTGIWWAMFISLVFQALLMAYLFQTRDWPAFAFGGRKKVVTVPKYNRATLKGVHTSVSGIRQPA
jgi:multidrug resistance protein, MATE family